jgi:hypothetical protein
MAWYFGYRGWGDVPDDPATGDPRPWVDPAPCDHRSPVAGRPAGCVGVRAVVPLRLAVVVCPLAGRVGLGLGLDRALATEKEKS